MDNKKINYHKTQLSFLVGMENPESVLIEIKVIISEIIPKFNFKSLDCIFYDILKLFGGEFPGYKKCNTEYHDLKHTTDILLAMTRLIHGYFIINKQLCEKDVFLGLVSALMHDTGYIQTLDDNFGTGAKYTHEHIVRSILFMENYFDQNDYSLEDFQFCKNCLLYTGFNMKINEINFTTNEKTIGKMLGTADLLGQMADRVYLEKLLFLYYEFMEGGILGFKNEVDILKKTFEFYEMTKKRIIHELDNIDKYMIYHFRERWNINRDLYKESIEKNINYLKFVLENHEKSYRDHLKRGNVIKKLYEEGFDK